MSEQDAAREAAWKKWAINVEGIYYRSGESLAMEAFAVAWAAGVAHGRAAALVEQDVPALLARIALLEARIDEIKAEGDDERWAREDAIRTAEP